MSSGRDVVVVGSGVVGCAIAYELSRRGVQVTVLDVRDIGRGATHASAGILAPFIEPHQSPSLRDIGARSLEMFDEFVARAVEDSGTGVEYVRNGTLEVATDEAELRRLEAAAATHADSGVASEFLDARAAHEIEPELAEDLLASLLVRNHGYVAATELTTALGRAATIHGARITAGCAVRRIAADGQHVRLETAQETLMAGTVVLAAGSWSGQLEIAGAHPLPVRPVRGQLLYLSWGGTPLRHVLWGPRCYLVPWIDGTLLVGATVEEAGFDERATVAGVHDLLGAACDIAPKAWQASFQGVRVGLRPATPDELPIVGRSRVVPGLIYATGHYRNGVLLAPLTAELVANLILEDRNDPAANSMSPARFGNV